MCAIADKIGKAEEKENPQAVTDYINQMKEYIKEILPLNEEDHGMEISDTSMSEDFGASPPKIIGIQNLGNTCYMSVGLQMLFQVSRLSVEFENSLAQNLDDPLIAALHHLFKSAQFASAALVPQTFKDTLGTVFPRFHNYRQHDAAEFLHTMLQHIGSVADISELFEVFVHSEKKKDCGHNTNEVQENWMLSLQVYSYPDWGAYIDHSQSLLKTHFLRIYFILFNKNIESLTQDVRIVVTKKIPHTHTPNCPI